jgi:hexosaminidase
MNVHLRTFAEIVVTAISITVIAPCVAKLEAADLKPTVCIIPQPVELEVCDGRFAFAADTQVVASSTEPAGAGAARAVAAKLVDFLAPAMGYRLSLVEDSPRQDNIVRLKVDPLLNDQLGGEGYQLEATARSIVISAAEPAGLFYGIQTLRQLLPPAIFNRQAARPLGGGPRGGG